MIRSGKPHGLRQIRNGVFHELLSVLKGKGTKMDKLRFAIMYVISLETINQAEVEAVETALRGAEADIRAFQYVKKIKSLIVSLAASADSASRSNIVDWAEKLYGHSLSVVTAGVKNLLSSDQQLAVARTVEALTEGKPNPETDSYLLVSRASKSGSSSYVKGPFKEATVFMIGGGNYIEYSSLQELSQRQEMVKNIIYGATEILTGTELVETEDGTEIERIRFLRLNVSQVEWVSLVLLGAVATFAFTILYII